MKAAVIVYPGSNCDRDMAVALRNAGLAVSLVWHKEQTLPEGTDLVAVPGGFSFGDYLRCGAIAARAPVTAAIVAHARAGGLVLGVCNGFQILTETGLLPGALLRNAGVKYICRTVPLRVGGQGVWTDAYGCDAEIALPIAHHDGNYTADAETLDRLEAEERVVLRYLDNPNGSQRDIAGIVSENRRVLGLMPHPERACDDAHGNADGARLFAHLAGLLTAA